jgi:hypothetical protein
MLNACINPNCGRPVRHLRHGKLYALYKRAQDGADYRRIEFFWLCEECAVGHSVHFNDGKPVVDSVAECSTAPQTGGRNEVFC